MLTLFGSNATADDAKDEAIKNDRKMLEGTWRLVSYEINGTKINEEYIKNFTVVNSTDGTWSLRSKGNEVIKGTSTIDPTQKPKTIVFIPSKGHGEGKRFNGIYILGEKTRKLCFASAGKDRPTEFTSTPGNEIFLATFEREKPK
ncbi:hypothetical protein HG66A1_61890 [Gimesia chilikensis]|uniref:TIGR03067 domain-containing protein n=2 Tax=Planctomycetaceae TaxID=126 RepID=A0A517PY94_9PLAN|nr:hypothetical protein HG66A1_61890 [Gimesia chilikensis]